VSLLASVAAFPQISPPAIVLQFGQVRRITSPDGRATLLTGVRSAERSSCPVLQLSTGGSAKPKHVLPICRTALVGWAPDSKAFFVNDDLASDSTVSYVFDVLTLRRTDIAALVKASDPEAMEWSKGHAYFEVERWDGPNVLQVRLRGHTDSTPVRCFVLRYNVTLAGLVRKLSRKVSTYGLSPCEG
jgi:hypothetical protein